ncbi:MAG: hypothetical protein A2079_03675 [Geobacteraceae bacterium GWC2_48_7]|nr:MAG: hypothetical protein A2079_03675 [Geobacteraceae bacterium GWC2_48_7]
MIKVLTITVITLVTVSATNCFAGYNCDDWVKRSGYCVNYIKSRIPVFPIPKDVAAITSLQNKEIKDVDKGDVAIFNLGNYWHVAYVEKVHVDQQGNATAVDVSEMNFGEQVSFVDFKNRWHPSNESEWKRAISCGVTKTYNQKTVRKNIELGFIDQLWSPESFAFQNFKSSSWFSVL